MNRLLCIALVSILAAGLAGCGDREDHRGATEATPATRRANDAVTDALPLADPKAFEDARRGLVARPKGQVRGRDGAVLWDFEAFRFVDGKAPPSVNPSLWRQARLNGEAGLYKVVDGVWQLRGFDISNLTLIEGASGWIVVDALTSRETAAAAMAFAEKHLGKRQVSALVFTHSHVDHFGGALGVIPAEEVAARRVPVVAPDGFLEEATSENVLAGPAMGRRAMYMYGSRLPRSARGMVDVGLGKAVAIGSIGILPPNRVVTHTPQEITLDGRRLVFQNAPGSEAPAELAFYLPEKRVFFGAELAVQAMHNLYTLRGAKVRDALRWASYIDEALRQFGEAEVLVGQHHWPVWGRARVREHLAKSRDLYRYIHDQTLRLANAGLSPAQIAERIRLPKSLEAYLPAHGYYGTLRHNARAVYQHYLGWYDGNPARLDPLPAEVAAPRYVELAGGIERLVGAAQAAFDRGEYRWAAELLDHAVIAQPKHEAARALLARSYDQLGYAAESAPWRNVYLSGAYELRHGAPEKGIDRSAVLDMLAHTPIERFLEAMAAALDGPAADGKTTRINLVFSDLNESWLLWIENAVLHFRRAPPDPEADATLTLRLSMFLRMMTGAAGARELVFGDDVSISGNRIALARFFGLFDKAPGTFALVAR